MFNLADVIRPNILKLAPYTSARDEYSGEANIYLDANENAYGSVGTENHNRYPDPKHLQLRSRLSEIKSISKDSIFVGNGSDEAIDLLIRIFCEPGKDKILALHPSYGMYKVSADTNDIGVKTVDLNPDFSLNLHAIISALEDAIKIVFVCNPNNPTGNSFNKADLLNLAKSCAEKGKLLVVDEAYIDFCEEKSLLSDLSANPNLVLLQTLSKAWGLAEIRLGMAFSSSEIINYFYKVKAPYNVNGVTQKIALQSLAQPEKKAAMVKTLVAERERLSKALKESKQVEKVYPSDSNYIFVKVKDAKRKFQELLQLGIVVRDRSSVRMSEGCFRVTVGTAEENDCLIAAFSGELEAEQKKAQTVKSSSNAILTELSFPERTAEVKRKTSETDILVKLNLDGLGTSQIDTGIGFFNHMLTQIAKHSGASIEIKVNGDLEVDEHHSIEDTAIALGEAFNIALGDKKGIERYGFLLPMDESLAQVALDFSGRAQLVWDAEFKREKIGEMPTEMFSHFFKSFSDSAKCNINIKADGENEHHKIEAIFKAFAKSIRQAIRRDPFNPSIPSSKGVL